MPEFPRTDCPGYVYTLLAIVHGCHARLNDITFVWDSEQALANLQKHGGTGAGL